MITYKNIIDDFKTIATNHFVINSFHSGMLDEVDINKLDENFRWRKGFLYCFSGYPQSGKSEILNWLMILRAKNNGDKICMYSPETDTYELINNLPSTSELAFGLMMSLLRNIPKSFNSVKSYNWDYEPYIGHQIKGKTIGTIGYGRLGKIMCDLFYGWGVEKLAYDPYERITTARGTPLKELLKKSDVVFLHTHVTDETRGMVDEEFLSKMKKGSYLINTARGELVDENAIIKSIKQEHLKGYGTDVIADEFGNINKSNLVEFALLNPNSNVVITPHIGGMTIEGQTKAYHWAVNKFKINYENR